MPSKNSVNKPKDNLNRQRKSKSLGRKKVLRGSITKTRSVSTEPTAASTSSAVALYTGAVQPTGPVTSNTLSKKRAKKIERNKKYAKARKFNSDQLLVDLQAKEEMDIDDDNEEEVKEVKKQSETFVREALWTVIEDAAAGSFQIDVSGEGTTLGGPVF
ncbi:unnamed protein product [Ambrosiozyma monospora]|uniref:Unnamed protein product n=1 Tax=Ambrosiozyma monospora TaxID=43982 RepID=A0A9W7DH29_AMBMO|nr:unnamed protein product [Ambrosiozyma monospora]